MSKVITSPVQRWAGTVTIADPLTLPQAAVIEDAISGYEPTEGNVKIISLRVNDEKQLPAILACVEKWELAKFPESVTLENFPASPRAASHNLVSWIFQEIIKVYFGEAEIPNE